MGGKRNDRIGNDMEGKEKEKWPTPSKARRKTIQTPHSWSYEIPPYAKRWVRPRPIAVVVKWPTPYRPPNAILAYWWLANVLFCFWILQTTTLFLRACLSGYGHIANFWWPLVFPTKKQIHNCPCASCASEKYACWYESEIWPTHFGAERYKQLEGREEVC